MNYNKIRQEFLITDMMERLGCDMYHRGTMYRAPYRQDQTPSMSVDLRKNVWCDFGQVRADGTPEGGGNIELCKMITGLSSNREAAQMIVDLFRRNLDEFISVDSPSRSQAVRQTKEPQKESGIRILSALNMVLSAPLKEYLRERGIHPKTASRWCYEVDFMIESTGRRLFAIGFPSDRGSWALRNSFFKGSNGQGISTIV